MVCEIDCHYNRKNQKNGWILGSFSVARSQLRIVQP